MQRYFSYKKIDDYLYLDKDDLYHINTVMRMKDHDQIEVVYDGFVYICEIIDQRFKIVNKLDKINKKKPYVTIIIPYLKEQKIDLILQKGTEMGVDEFIFCKMERSMVKIDDKKLESKLSRWIKICKEASEQSKRVNIPNIKNISNFKELNGIYGLNLTCSTQKNLKNIKNALKSHKECDKINLVIGPEGGLTTNEEKLLVDLGFALITLGDLIMRVETVPLYLTSVINYEYME